MSLSDDTLMLSMLTNSRKVKQVVAATATATGGGSKESNNLTQQGQRNLDDLRNEMFRLVETVKGQHVDLLNDQHFMTVLNACLKQLPEAIRKILDGK